MAAQTVAFDHDTAYTVRQYGGVAFRYIEPETEPDEDTEWSGYEVETGRYRFHMVGDDHVFAFDPEDVIAIPEDGYCASCGQIGCTADGRDRS